MAKGWESKAVAAQIEEKSAVKASESGKAGTSEELQRHHKKTELKLSRSRVEEQLAASKNARYTQMLQRALAELDEQIVGLDK